MSLEKFLAAAEQNDIFAMEQLLNEDPDLIHGHDERLGWTSLHYAAGHQLTVEFLLSRGADPNAKALGGETPLHLAHNYAAAQVLIEAGANPEAEDSDGMTPLSLAYVDQDFRHLRILAGSQANYHFLTFARRAQDRIEATYQGDLQVFRVLSVDQDVCEGNRETPKPSGAITYTVTDLKNLRRV